MNVLKLPSHISTEKKEYFPNHREFLNSPDTVLLIEEGEGELFSTMAEGALSYITHIKAGSLLFGLPPSPFMLTFLATAPVRLRMISLRDLRSWVESDPQAAQLLAPHLEAWIHLLEPVRKRFKIDSCDLFIEANQTLSVQTGKTLSSPYAVAPEKKGDVIWVTVSAGAFKLFDKVEIGQGPYPIST